MRTRMLEGFHLAATLCTTLALAGTTIAAPQVARAEDTSAPVASAEADAPGSSEADLQATSSDATSAGASIRKSGTWGSCSWSIDSAGHLRIWPTNGTSGTLDESRGFSHNPGWDDEYDESGSFYPWYEHRSLVKTASIEGKVTLAPYAAGMFNDFSSLTTVDASGLDTSQATNMSTFFANCTALTSVNVTGWDLGKLESAWNMFGGCESLTAVDVSSWNTAKLQDMERMFSGCTSLASLDVSRWNTANVETIEGMFQGCAALTTLPVTNWNVAKVRSMNRTFSECTGLQTLDTSKWKTSSLVDLERAFENCHSLTSVKVSGWNVSKAQFMDSLFDGCSSLTTLDLSGWNNSKVEQSTDMFQGVESLTQMTVGSQYDTSKGFPEMMGNSALSWWSKNARRLYTGAQIRSSRRRVADSYGIADLSNATATAVPGTYLQTGKLTQPLLSVKIGSTSLAFGRDYGFTCTNNVEAGTATVTITGRGAFTGTTSCTYNIADTLTNPFADIIEEGDAPTAHASHIVWLASVGVTSGWDESNGTKTFRPNTNIKRGDMAAFLFRLGMRWGLVDGSYEPKAETVESFTDVTANTSHRYAILWLAETGISTGWKQGDEAEFRPNEPVKRGQMAAFLWRLAQLAKVSGNTDVDSTSFRDIDEGTSFHDEIWWLAANGISTGWKIETPLPSDSDEATPDPATSSETDGEEPSVRIEYEYRPNSPVKRGDMAAFLHRIEDLYDPQG